MTQCTRKHTTLMPYPGRDWLSRANPNAFVLTQNGTIVLASGGRFADSRYDVLAANPHTILQCASNATFINDQVQPGDFNLFNWLGTQLDKAGSTTLLKHHILGFLSYEWMDDTLLKTPKAAGDLNCPQAYVCVYDWIYLVDHAAQTAELQWLAAPEYEQEKKARLWVDELRSDHSAPHAAATCGPFNANISYADYRAGFEKIKDYINAGDCYQVNYAQRFESRFSGNAWQVFCTLYQANQAPYSCFIQTDNGCVISLSPELFIQTDGQRAWTKPIKGTMPRAADKNKDKDNKHKLAQSIKNKAENLMIVDLLRNDFSKVCALNSVQTKDLFSIETFPAVHHMVSTVEGALHNPAESVDLLAACFPGGSITGAPKKRAMEIIKEVEPNQRHIYCGSIFSFSNQYHLTSNICIRTLWIENDKLYLWAGGGIVADSDCETEYNECYDKVSKITPVLSQSPDEQFPRFRK